MTIFEVAIEPYRAVGPIKLGMTMSEIRDALDEEPSAFLKGADSEMPTHAFRNDSIHVYFRSPGVCKAVEFFSPANPLLEGRSLIGQPYQDVKTWFAQRDKDMVENDAGFTSKLLGVGIYAPAARKAPAEPVESVIVFEKGYHER